jgi:hypothetical protein
MYRAPNTQSHLSAGYKRKWGTAKVWHMNEDRILNLFQCTKSVNQTKCTPTSNTNCASVEKTGKTFAPEEVEKYRHWYEEGQDIDEARYREWVLSNNLSWPPPVPKVLEFLFLFFFFSFLLLLLFFQK